MPSSGRKTVIHNIFFTSFAISIYSNLIDEKTTNGWYLLD
jgi:hypothetical protein